MPSSPPLGRAAFLVLIAVLAAAAPAPASAAKPRADLVVTRVGDPPAKVVAGAALRVPFTVRNAGSRRARASTIGFSLSTNARRDAADVPLGKAKVGALSRRRSARGAGRLTVPGHVRAGIYRLLACADLAGKVRERSERNNCRLARASVTVVPTGAPSGPPVRPGPGTGELPPPPTGPGTGTPDPGDPEPPTGPDPIPPDPASVAPALPKTTAVSPFDAANFLFTGAAPVQPGVSAGTISRDRILVLRGRVLDRAGVPIQGVRVTVLDHPELGRTQTRADGRYDLAVNGVGMTLIFEAAGFLTSQRTIDPAWETYDRIEDLVMVPVDGAVTRIAKDSDEPFQVAAGTTTTDTDGSRRALLLFPKDLSATMTLPDGSKKPLGDMNVRITEFTAGDQGVEAMPGSLPGTSGYTYAAEFSVDEALAARATQVDFDRPVINYVQNFIGAPVGSDVPTGAYDREEAEWEPARDGRVIKVASEADGKAVLEGADGLGVGDDELRVLADRYEPGQELWRVPMRHFTPWDHNWPYGPPRNAQPPKLKEFVWQDPNDPCRAKGSIIGCESGTLGESLPLAGTHHSLSYTSDRQPGWESDDALEVPITGPAIGEGLKGIQLKVSIAGKEIIQRWCDPAYPTTGERTCAGLPTIAPNIRHRVPWDGLDAYGRRPQGRQVATIQLIYVYEMQYYDSEDEFDQSFAAFPTDLEFFDGRRSCGSISKSLDAHFFCGVPIGQTVTRSIGSWEAMAADGLGGWSISGHHAYDPGDGVVHLGDGTTRRADALGATTRTLVGGSGFQVGSPAAEGQPATKVTLGNLSGSTRTPEGETYFAVWGREHGIFRVGLDGKVRRFAGKRSTETDPLAKRLEEEGPASGDGGPATEAILGGDPLAMSVGPDGSLYFVVTRLGATYPRGLIRKVAPNGTISTVAGSMDTGVGFQDGVPGPQTAVTDPQAVLATADGSLYWTERPQTTNGMKGRLRRLSASGLVETIAGGGTDNAADDEDLGDGEPARDNDFGGVPYGLAMGADGSIYFALPNAHIVERVAPDGRIRRFAGNRTAPIGAPQYGQQAVASAIGNPTGVATGPNGEVYIRHDQPGAPSFVFISKVRADGVLEHVAGLPRGFCGGISQNGEQATRTCIEAGRGMMVDPDGTPVYQDGQGDIRAIESVLGGFGLSNYAVPSADGSEVWEFDAAGRHLRTVDGITGVKLERFVYDGAGRLTGIEDRDGNVTTIERAGDGTPLAIVAPGGQRTGLELDAGGRIAAVRDGLGRATTMTYHDGGLLATLKRPEGGTSTLTYDARGRLTKDVDPDGVVTTLNRTENDGLVKVDVSVGGRVTSYEVEALANGDRVRTVRRPGGIVTKLVTRPDGSRVRTDPDGTVTTVEPATDPRWGNKVVVPAKETKRTPGGKERIRTWDRTAHLADPLDRFSVTGLSVAVTENPGGRTEWSYSSGMPSNLDDQTMTVRSPEGRTSTTTLDHLTRPTKIVPATGATPIVVAYDARGRVTSAAQGTSATTLAYDARNRVVQRGDGEGNVVGYGYDLADRLTQLQMPGGGTFAISYAADGSRTVTTPGGRTFAMGVTPAGRERSFRSAGQANAHVRAFGASRELLETAMPSGAKRVLGYDSAGRLSSEASPEAQRSYGYADGADVFASLGWQRPGGGGAQSLALGHDGLLPTSEAATGAATGTVSTAWGAGWLPTQQVVEAAGVTVTTPLAFDRDRMLKQLGPFTIERLGPGGAQSAVRLTGGGMDLTTARDTLARLNGKRLAVAGAERFGEALTYDRAGRVGSTAMAGKTRFYEYDGRGQLRRVRSGSATGQVVEEYSYDSDGNRTGAAYDGGASEPALYGAQSGRLTKRANVDYTFDTDGFLTKRGQDTFAYARSGELLSATAGGKTVTYDYDALGRRTARHEGGATERYLHGDPANPLRITAWIDAGGTLNVPRYDGDGTLFAIERGGSRVYVATDHLGSPRAITDGAGTTLRTIEYDAFGRVTGGTGSFDLPIGYAGGLSDPVTGLVRFGARDYEPASGRWTGEDPTFLAGSPGNLYAYVGSNPVTLTDPTGLVCVGFSAYEGVGGGIQLCRDNSIDNAFWSLCAELGVGLGGGVDVDLAGGAQETGGAMVAEATWRAGWAGGTVGAELDLDCFNLKGSAKAQYGPAAVGLDSKGDVSVGYSSPEQHIGGKLQGKVAYKRCAKF